MENVNEDEKRPHTPAPSEEIKRGKTVHIMITLYLDENEESKRVEELFRRKSISCIIKREPSEYDKRLKRPYMIIGNPDGDHLGPSSNIKWIKWVAECLASSPNRIIDPRIT
jgi:hypothetical protein